MTTFTIHAARTQLSKPIERAQAGEEVIIARRDKPVVRLVPIELPKPTTQLSPCRTEPSIHHTTLFWTNAGVRAKLLMTDGAYAKHTPNFGPLPGAS